MTPLKFATEETPALNPLDFFKYIPGPVAAVLATLIVLVWIISEIKGWTNGPLAKRVTKAQEKAEEAAQERDIRWADRDRRYEELEEVVNTLKEEVERLRAQVGHMNMVGDAQNRLLIAHSDWDREAQAKLNERGIVISPPPQLYVYFGATGGILPA